ncbi:MAG: MATE family efflux transporter [Acidobacteriota bacterium]
MSDHAFAQRPHRTVLLLALPAFFSMVAEPLTGLADTAFIAALGSEALTALGLGATTLSAIFWVFSFLHVTTQTEVARALGAGERERAAEIIATALTTAVLIGVGLGIAGVLLADWLVVVMGATAEIRELAKSYLAIRFLAAPALLMTTVSAAALRGLQSMRTVMWIATGVNLLNLALDPLLIFGPGPFPALGVAGAAWASVIAQGIGGVLSVVIVLRLVGRRSPRREHLGGLFKVGIDVFLRTGLLSAFLALSTRAATLEGELVAAANQVIRQTWLTCAFALDALGTAGHSLVGYFLGAGDPRRARQAAAVAITWGVVTGLVFSLVSMLGRELVAVMLVPPEAHAVFFAAWWVFALGHPVNAVTFVTDGIHFGARDYRWLRNTMVVATAVGWLGLELFVDGENALVAIWWVTLAWVGVRAGSSMLRIWPGLGRAPLRAEENPPS